MGRGAEPLPPSKLEPAPAGTRLAGVRFGSFSANDVCGCSSLKLERTESNFLV